MAHSKKQKIKYRSLLISVIISAVILLFGLHLTENISTLFLWEKLFFPLLRLMAFICIGFFLGQLIESTGWTRYLAVFAGPFFKFGHMGKHCSAAFTTAFISGVAANAMLIDFYKEKIITKKQLFLSNFVNQLPAYFLHLPTTFFIVIPLTGKAGVLYFVLTFLAMLLRIIQFLCYGHFFIDLKEKKYEDMDVRKNDQKNHISISDIIKKKLPARVINIAVFVLPVYIAVFVINSLGMFKAANELISTYVTTVFIPIESLSVVILSFAAEFTSGFAAAGALMDAEVLSIKQTVIALIAGNILAFPIRALKHQLPRYIGVFSPKMGMQILLMGQFFRIASLVLVGILYYILF